MPLNTTLPFLFSSSPHGKGRLSRLDGGEVASTVLSSYIVVSSLQRLFALHASPFLPSFLVHALFSPLYDHDPFNALFFASSLSLPLISSLHTPLSRDSSYEHSECVPNTENIGGVLGARGGERENEGGPVTFSKGAVAACFFLFFSRRARVSFRLCSLELSLPPSSRTL